MTWKTGSAAKAIFRKTPRCSSPSDQIHICTRFTIGVSNTYARKNSQNRRRMEARANTRAVPDPAPEGDGAPVHRRVHAHQGRRQVRLRCVRAGTLYVRGQVRFALWLAQFHRTSEVRS